MLLVFMDLLLTQIEDLFGLIYSICSRAVGVFLFVISLFFLFMKLRWIVPNSVSSSKFHGWVNDM